MTITDFHVHAFPDSMAGRAMRALEESADGVTAHLDGRVSSLLKSMDCAGIDRAVICSIATKPEQFGSILDWSGRIASDRIIPFPSVHPRDPDMTENLGRVAEEGFKGIKLHPYYQDYYIDEDALFPLYERVVELGLMIVCHTGFDIAFERVRRADPGRILNVVQRFPELKLITTHLGSWDDWDDVRQYLLGKPIYMEISFSLELLPREEARDILGRHPMEYVLFGTDSPWTDQSGAIELLRGLDLDPKREAAILSGNADRLLMG